MSYNQLGLGHFSTIPLLTPVRQLRCLTGRSFPVNLIHISAFLHKYHFSILSQNAYVKTERLHLPLPAKMPGTATGREPERRLWRIQRGRSVGSGRRGTKAHCRRGHSPGTATGNRWTGPSVPVPHKKPPLFPVEALCWHYLFWRPVTRQLSSAQTSLTSVFGMGTGGPSLQSIPTHMDGIKPSFIVKSHMA